MARVKMPKKMTMPKTKIPAAKSFIGKANKLGAMKMGIGSPKAPKGPKVGK